MDRHDVMNRLRSGLFDDSRIRETAWYKDKTAKGDTSRSPETRRTRRQSPNRPTPPKKAQQDKEDK